MTRFPTKIAAGAAVALGIAYMALALAKGHSAQAEIPPDLSLGAEAGLDVWKTAAALVQAGDQTLIVDVRPAAEYARYHIPGSASEPGANAARLRALALGRSWIVVVADKDEAARRLAGEAREGPKDARFRYLADGARAWYLAFDLPVPLFSEAPPPYGYVDSLAAAKIYFAQPKGELRARTVAAIATLARLNYQPSLLKQAGKAKASAAPRKKISGGCG